MLDDQVLSVLREVEWSQVLSYVQRNPTQVTDRTLQLVIGVSVGDYGMIPAIPVPPNVIKAILEARIVQSNQPCSILRAALQANDISADVFQILFHEKYCWWLPTFMPGFDFGLAERHFLNEALQIHYTDPRRGEWSEDKLEILLRRFPFAFDIILSGAIKCHQSLGNIRKIVSKVVEQGYCFNQIRTIISMRCSYIGRSPLELMMKFGRHDIIQCLSQNIPVLFEKNYIFTFNLLHAIVRTLPCPDTSRETGMLESHLANYIGLASMLIDLYPQALGKLDEFGCLPIHYVCQFETSMMYSSTHVSLVKLFIEKGLEQNIGGPQGRGGLLVSNQDGQVPLELLVISHISSVDLRAILLDSRKPPLLGKGDIENCQLLRSILRVKSDRKDLLEKTAMLVDLDHDSLSRKDEFGNLPLHFSVLSSTDKATNLRSNNDENFSLLNGNGKGDGLRALHFGFLLQKGVQACVGGEHGYGGLLVRNNDGNSSLDLIIQFWDRSFQNKEKISFHLRNMQALACINSCWNTFQTKLPLLQIVFESSSCDYLMIGIIVGSYKGCLKTTDDRGNTPLHTLLKQYKRMENKRFDTLTFSCNGTDRLDNAIDLVLFDDKHAISKRDRNGRLPLHVALENCNLAWPNMISRMISHKKSAITERDPITGLYPYHLAAVSKVHHGNLSCIYELLRNAPHLLDNPLGTRNKQETMRSGTKRKLEELS